MLEITLPQVESFNEKTSEFITYPEVELRLEHSLYSLSKWESKWEKPYLSDSPKSDEETLDYIRCMSQDPVDNETLLRLTNKDFEKIGSYISASMTATWFNEDDKKTPSRQVITAEIIYHWMIQNQVWLECEYWHLNRLITLLKVCSAKNSPEKKMSRQDAAAKQRALNEARKAKYKTSG